MDELNRKTIEQFKSTKKIPLVLMLDDVRSLHNVGSIFRTADAFLIEKIWLCGITGTPPNKEINKTALGSTESVTWEYFKDPVLLLQQLKAEGYKILAIEQAENATFLPAFSPSETEKYCLIFGNEVFGVNQELINNSDFCVEIPQFGTKHSLNISVSCGILIWDLVAKLKFYQIN